MAGHLELFERRVRDLLDESKKLRYYKTTATSNGASDGSTIISTNLSELNDSWNGCEVTILDGVCEGQVRTVEDFTSSTGTLTFTNNVFPKQVVSGVSFEITERGTWTGRAIKQWLLDAINFLAGVLPKKVLGEYILVTSVTPSSNGFANFPANALDILGIDINDKPAVEIPFEERSRFDDDAYIDPVSDDSFVYCVEGGSSAGQIHFKPEVNATVRFHYVPLMTAFLSSGNTNFPAQFHSTVVIYTAGIAWLQNERPDLAQAYFKRAEADLASKGVKVRLTSKQEKGA